MSGLCFRRRVGAAADVKELEYCVALHQTVPRDNATVSSTDVRCLLASRYGLQLSHAQAGAVVRSLGGMMKHTEIDTVPSDNELWVETDSSEGENLETKLVPLASLSPSRSVGNNTTLTSDAWHPSQPTPLTDGPTEEYLDMVQLLSILLLPYLARHADEFKNGRHPPPSIRKNVGNRFTQWYWNIVHRIECWLANRWYRVYESCRPQPANVMDHAQKALLKRLNDGSAHGSSERGEGYFRQRQGRPTPAPILDEQLVESLLLEYGEVERAQNSELIRDMVAVAQTSSGRLDHAALLQAVSMDLQEWEVESEDRLSTLFEDVFGTTDPATVTNLEFADAVDSLAAGECVADLENNNKDDDQIRNDVPISVDAYMEGYEQPNSLRSPAVAKQRSRLENLRSCSAQYVCFAFSCLCCLFLPGRSLGPFANERFSIDMVRDEFFSSVTVVVIWLFFLWTAMLYAFIIIQFPTLEEVCDLDEFWCRTVDAIYSWASIAILLSIFGLLMVLPLSFGNSPRHRKLLVQLSTLLIPFGYAVIPYLSTRAIQESLEGGEVEINDSGVQEILQNSVYQRLQSIPLVLGCLLALLFFFVVLSTIVRWCVSSSKLWSRLLNGITSSSSAWADTRLKRAATRKLNKLMMNARRLHQPNEVLAGLLSGVGVSAESVSRDQTMRNYVLDEERTEPVGGLFWTWWKILNGSLFDTEGIWINTRLQIIQVAQIVAFFSISVVMLGSVRRIADRSEEARADLDENVPDWVRNLVPTRQIVNRALYPASFSAMLVMLLLVLIYVPSSVSTILKFRSQIIPSLRSPLFERYTKAVDSAYMNTANAIYGLIGSAILFYLMVGLILFLFQWPFSQDFMRRMLSWGLGLGITMGLKMVLTMSCRRVQYRSFYRIRPHAANLSALALECWYAGLGGSVLLGRITQFLFAALFWVGRIDVAFLSSDVVLFGYHFDYVPINFIKEILVHEAHRHPYLERLAQMYLMKLRYKDFAACGAAAAWRQLYVVALFPWLAKHRVFDAERRSQAAAALAERRRRQEEYGEGDLRASF